MKIAFEICFFIALAGIPLQLFYWCAVRPVLLDRIQLEIVKLNMSLHKITVSASKDEKDAIKVVQWRCDVAMNKIQQFDMVRLAFVKVTKEDEMRMERDKLLVENASVEIRKINRLLGIFAVIAALINAPGLVILLMLLTPIFVLVLLCCLLTNKLKEAWDFVSRPVCNGFILPDKRITC